jgi:hypothetical protein
LLLLAHILSQSKPNRFNTRLKIWKLLIGNQAKPSPSRIETLNIKPSYRQNFTISNPSTNIKLLVAYPTYCVTAQASISNKETFNRRVFVLSKPNRSRRQWGDWNQTWKNMNKEASKNIEQRYSIFKKLIEALLKF